MHARTLFCLLAPIMLLGCASTERQATDVRVRTELSNLGKRIDQLTERQDAIENRNDRLAAEIEKLERAIREARNLSTGEARKMAVRVDALKKELDTIDTARREDRKAIVDEITAKVSRMVQQLTPPTGRRSQNGYEHTVQPGETLSEIASHYKVTAKRIVEANKLVNPNSIRVGQKLFIPD